MLRLLQHAFASGAGGPAASFFCDAAINAMTTLIQPLGEELALLPSGHPDGSRAGTAFGLTRHVTLPSQATIARIVAAERGRELAETAGAFARLAGAPSSFGLAAANLRRIVDRLQTPLC
ncbi:hypothetical protein QWE_19153 [Agrobacterium albertimagni AOL15]|uniref:Uncharacterized protein n=1 Tax=Agrobacterium albertimagni AOL15 TaxID=1156935 RepID=K2Q2E0_9HYPH|nr:hypothetical protein QWE_19153 [Agrobacterium albertimagni AOL15]